MAIFLRRRVRVRRKGFTPDPPWIPGTGEETAEREPLTSGRGIRRWRPALLLAIGSVAFALANVLLIVSAAFAEDAMRLGPLDSGKISFLSMGLDTFAAVLFAVSLRGLARTREGRAKRWLRRSATLLVAWAVLSTAWRFLLPLASGTDAETVFYEIFTPEDVVPHTAGPLVLAGMLTLWTVAAAVFVIAQLALLVARLNAREEDPLQRLPVLGWFVAAALSFLGTLLVVFALGTQIEGGTLSDVFLPGAFLKVLAAPCVFLGAYAEGARWAWDQVRGPRQAPRPEPEVDGSSGS